MISPVSTLLCSHLFSSFSSFFFRPYNHCLLRLTDIGLEDRVVAFFCLLLERAEGLGRVLIVIVIWREKKRIHTVIRGCVHKNVSSHLNNARKWDFWEDTHYLPLPLHSLY
jgi:hypothetical protein